VSTKLTLNVDETVISKAKIYAQKNDQSISKLVENFLKDLVMDKNQNAMAYGPLTQELSGIISADENCDYQTLLEDAILEKNL
jgi:hypothetical protein